MNRRNFANLTGAFLLAGTVGLGAFGSAAAQTLEEEALLEVGTLPDMILGEEDAPTTIIEYASLTCPHCKTFHEKTFPGLKEKYIDTGEVRFILREFPPDTAAMAGAMLARCAPENIYFEVVGLLLEQQEEWTEKDDVYNALLKLARNVGFTQEKFDSCLSDQKILDGITWIKNRAAEEFNVRATPTLIVDGELYSGALPLEDLERIIQNK